MPDVDGDEIEISRVNGVVTTRRDGVDAPRIAKLESLLKGDETLIAHRFVRDAWVVETFAL